MAFKRGCLLGNEEIHLGGDSPIFEIIYSNLEQLGQFCHKDQLTIMSGLT